MGIVGDIFGGRIRAEMKERTSEILISIRGHKEALDSHRIVLEKVLAALQGASTENESLIGAELRKTTGNLVKSEKRLCGAVDSWTRFMEKTVEKLT